MDVRETTLKSLIQGEKQLFVDVSGTSISFLARSTLAVRIWPTVRSPTG
jgi:hypothetical protein